MELRKLESLELTGKKVFLRLDLNVPLKNGKITDDTRIREALPTIKYILERTHRLCIASHLGRPKNKISPEFSLEPVAQDLSKKLGLDVVLYPDFTKEPSSSLFSQLDKNQIILLENLRFYPGEEANDSDYAEKLMEGYDYYVNDAFGTCHRAHASVVKCAEKIRPDSRAAGFLIQRETKALTEIMLHPEHPFTVVMGGSKVSDKIAVILNLLNNCNDLIIGGAMAYTFLKFRGVSVGSSRVEEDKMQLVDSIYRMAESRKVQIHLPFDHMAAKEFSETAQPVYVEKAEIPAGLMGLDIGPKTQAHYANVIKASKTVLWNGPMGVFEWKNFAQGSIGIAKAMAESSAKTVVGGGDSVAAANLAGVADKMSHVSTGGGAALEFLEGQVLPGLKILEVGRK